MCFRSGKIVVRVDPCNDFASCLITSSTESELVSFNCDGFPRIGLEQACGCQKPDFDARYQRCWDLHYLKVAQGILHYPHHMTLPFNSQLLWPWVLIGLTKSLQSGEIEMLAPESQISGNIAVLGRDSWKRSVDWRAMRRMVE